MMPHANPTANADWAAAVELGCDALEDEAVRRGCEGHLKPVFHRGKEVGAIREYSDVLLIFMLKARRPFTSIRPVWCRQSRDKTFRSTFSRPGRNSKVPSMTVTTLSIPSASCSFPEALPTQIPRMKNGVSEAVSMSRAALTPTMKIKSFRFPQPASTLKPICA